MNIQRATETLSKLYAVDGAIFRALPNHDVVAWAEDAHASVGPLPLKHWQHDFLVGMDRPYNRGASDARVSADGKGRTREQQNTVVASQMRQAFAATKRMRTAHANGLHAHPAVKCLGCRQGRAAEIAVL